MCVWKPPACGVLLEQLKLRQKYQYVYRWIDRRYRQTDRQTGLSTCPITSQDAQLLVCWLSAPSPPCVVSISRTPASRLPVAVCTGRTADHRRRERRRTLCSLLLLQTFQHLGASALCEIPLPEVLQRFSLVVMHRGSQGQCRL